ncbi:hypothetical protein MRX96_039297 [Rhipicephalus microplus]
MATADPDRGIRQDQCSTRLQEPRHHRDALTGHSSHIGGPSPKSFSPTPVRVRELVTRPPQRNRTSAGDETRQRHTDDAMQDTQVQDERSCIVFWVVGAAFTFPLILSTWLVLVPFLVRANWTTTSTTPLFSLTPQHTMHTMSSTCIVPVTWSTLPPSLNAAISRIAGGTTYSLPVPFALCPYVVYWSVGIEDGNLKSRQPSFDEQYGLHRLRKVADSFNFKALKILLALGGYPEDAPHFSRLGWDIDAMNRLMRDVVDSVDRFGLNGITVHWAEAHDGCTGTDDITVLKTLLYSFRTWFNARRWPDIMITVILEAEHYQSASCRGNCRCGQPLFLGDAERRAKNPAKS